ncbi:MAG: dihydrodiol dehydrogenase [Armatimonadota bacterium]|nr:dihydrodiol dehydrogenase [Armatimonadota bacterium]MDR5676433.1 dihydrodiol dehydrogenase [Armatimonadota bacterium]MDR5689827.1 dihydrodiol dehydrogenase [Armatimonadota bacterium]MDR7406102.1 dihydrodiol dehydrogenase [Armatimonadota bacterium]MDR7412718.1 dihydrodiol dehydrogenase [Armatimonadota bacterium]
MRRTAEDALEFELANEFAVVRVRRRRTRNGERLEIEAPRLGRRISLCPLELESLTWQTPETFSRFLSAPFGPEEGD